MQFPEDFYAKGKMDNDLSGNLIVMTHDEKKTSQDSVIQLDYLKQLRLFIC